MDTEKKLELVMKKPTEEVLTPEELRNLFETNSRPKHYIGFEISGMVHLGTGLACSMKIKDFLEAGIETNILLADYHTMLNKKLGGDIKKIRKVALGYFKHAFVSLGLDEEKVRYVLASDIYDDDYWQTVIDVARNTTLKRMLRCITIMGRSEDSADAASILYPAMQAADIYKLNVDIVHSGMDQRKVHVLARELSEKLNKKKPIAVHGHLLMGLQGPKKMGVEFSDKMSKSKPETCIFIHDSESEIAEKLKRAYCPERQTNENPVIDLCEWILMREGGLLVERPQKYGGDIEFGSFAELKKAYTNGELHPADLKNAVAKRLSDVLRPCREYFNKNKHLLDMISNPNS
ncbi:MAG: tyrosine--tRNA ligase [Candidatus Micrarchaeia archaeon]